MQMIKWYVLGILLLAGCGASVRLVPPESVSSGPASGPAYNGNPGDALVTPPPTQVYQSNGTGMTIYRGGNG